MRFQDLRAWQLGMDLAEEVYRLTCTFPKSELFGISSQMRRSSRSVYANIAEGFGRKAPREFVRFLRIANGSLFELESDLEFVLRIQLTSAEQVTPVRHGLQQTARALHGLIQGASLRIR
jgi:four helix bundle protein